MKRRKIVTGELGKLDALIINIIINTITRRRFEKRSPVHSTSKRDTGPSKSLHLVSHTPGHQGDAHHDGNHRCHHRCCCFWALRPWHPPPKSHHRHDDDYECVLPHYLDCWTRTILMMISDVFIRDGRGQKRSLLLSDIVSVCLFVFVSLKEKLSWVDGW